MPKTDIPFSQEQNSLYYAFANKKMKKPLTKQELTDLAATKLTKLKKKLTLTPLKEKTHQKKVLLLEQSLVKYAQTPDEELLSQSIPTENTQTKHNYKLNKEQQQARLVYVHRQLSRGVHAYDIADKLHISRPMIFVLKRELEQRLRDTMIFLDIPQAIGDTLHFYDDVRSVALSYTKENSPHSPRTQLEAVRVALEAERDKNNFLKLIGVYSKDFENIVIKQLVNPQGKTFDNTPDQQDHLSLVHDIVDTLRTYAQQRPEAPLYNDLAPEKHSEDYVFPENSSENSELEEETVDVSSVNSSK